MEETSIVQVYQLPKGFIEELKCELNDLRTELKTALAKLDEDNLKGFTISKAAKHTGLNQSVIRNAIDAGKLPYKQHGKSRTKYILFEDLKNFAAAKGEKKARAMQRVKKNI